MLSSFNFEKLICNECGFNLILKDTYLECCKCKNKYQIEDKKIVFNQFTKKDVVDSLDKLKYLIKKNHKLYYFLMNLISPVFFDKSLSNFIRNYIDLDKNEKKLFLNIGSGNSKISEHIINIDIFAYENVDIVCNIDKLPFKDNSVDIIINIAVLEHLANPKKVIDEIHRVLKPGGIVYTMFPFIQGFHASPHDYTRVTFEGIKELHKEFKTIEVKPFGGPTSGLLWILQEWVAIVLSFGNKKLHGLIYILMMLLTFPIKFLDLILIKNPLAKNISLAFIFIGKKK